jgi:uncharacterized protein YjbI with pentapeptide repeats
MPPRKSNKQPEREPAALPRFEDLEPAGAAAMLSGETIRDARLTGGDLSSQPLPQSRMFSSVVEKVSFSEAVFSAARWDDVQFLSCDFSNCVFHALEARRVEFIDCRMTGVKASGCTLHDVLFEGCDLKYAVLREASLATCEFTSTQMGDADLAAVRAENCLFRQCSLSGADLSRSVWRECDLRGAAIERIIIDGAGLKTCTITASQAIELAVLMGLRIG